MLTSEDLIQSLNTMDRRVKRLQLTQIHHLRPSLGIGFNTYTNWKSTGFRHLSVASYLALLQYVEKMEARQQQQYSLKVGNR